MYVGHWQVLASSVNSLRFVLGFTRFQTEKKTKFPAGNCCVLGGGQCGRRSERSPERERENGVELAKPEPEPGGVGRGTHFGVIVVVVVAVVVAVAVGCMRKLFGLARLFSAADRQL